MTSDLDFVKKMLSMTLPDMIRGLLEHPIFPPYAPNHKREWSLQGFGMLRLYITPEVRLHVWDDRYQVPGVTLVHDHPWNFRSEVLAGRITNVVMSFQNVVMPLQDAPEEEKATHWKGTILCGPNPEKRGVLSKERVRLRESVSTTYHRGESYKMTWNQVHLSRPERGTVTLCERSAFRKDTEHAHVFFEKDQEWVSAEPRPATDEEVLDICQHSLRTWWRT